MKKKMIVTLTVLAAVMVLAAAVFCVHGGAEKMDGVQAELTEMETIAEQEDMSAAEEMEEEEVFEIAEIYGKVMEVTDAYVLIENAQTGMIQANISDDTMIEGTESFEAGQVVKVLFDGIMTRSIPAQINAMLIGVYTVKGEVTEIADGCVTVKSEDTQEEVIITLLEDAQEIAVGDWITAYTTGTMTMSLPPQMNAVSIVK